MVIVVTQTAYVYLRGLLFPKFSIIREPRIRILWLGEEGVVLDVLLVVKNVPKRWAKYNKHNVFCVCRERDYTVVLSEKKSYASAIFDNLIFLRSSRIFKAVISFFNASIDILTFCECEGPSVCIMIGGMEHSCKQNPDPRNAEGLDLCLVRVFRMSTSVVLTQPGWKRKGNTN